MQATQISMSPHSIMALKHAHGLWCLHVSWTSEWCLLAVQTTGIYMVLCHCVGYDTITALEGNMGSGLR